VHHQVKNLTSSDESINDVNSDHDDDQDEEAFSFKEEIEITEDDNTGASHSKHVSEPGSQPIKLSNATSRLHASVKNQVSRTQSDYSNMIDPASSIRQ